MQVFRASSKGYEAIPHSEDEEADEFTNGMEQSFRRKRPRPWLTYAVAGVGALGRHVRRTRLLLPGADVLAQLLHQAELHRSVG